MTVHNLSSDQKSTAQINIQWSQPMTLLSTIKISSGVRKINKYFAFSVKSNHEVSTRWVLDEIGLKGQTIWNTVLLNWISMGFHKSQENFQIPMNPINLIILKGQNWTLLT